MYRSLSNTLLIQLKSYFACSKLNQILDTKSNMSIKTHRSIIARHFYCHKGPPTTWCRGCRSGFIALVCCNVRQLPIKGCIEPPRGQIPNNLHQPDGRVAQLVEHRTENPSVGGSSPPPTTFSLPGGPSLYTRAGYALPLVAGKRFFSLPELL